MGFANVIISYVYDGTHFVLDFNTTFPASYAAVALRGITPDGKYIIYA
jgi:hypothetical protein